MPFDQPTRNRLARFVGDARTLLTVEFTRQLQHEYGLDPTTGAITALDRLTALDDSRRATARLLRDTLAHYLAGQPAPTDKARQEALDRIVREQAFTVLNRLCALRMAEARGILIESIAKGYQSRGFQLYARLAGTALGETGDAYRTYLFSLFDEFGVDLAVLFDRFSPQGRLFPRASTLLQLLEAINHPDLEPLWAEDETIGWIYQYFNSKEERKAMRDASQAPRNSRELAVRNQFFTPRYVVEFLTDNTLGRIWYEMRKGKTRLTAQCRYLVRRPVEIFLDDPDQYLPDECRPWVRRVRSGDFTELPDDPTELELASISFAFNGYTVAEELGRSDLLDWAREQLERYTSGGQLPTSALDLWFLLFALQREWRIITGSGSAGEEFLTLWRQLYKEWKSAIQDNGSDLSQQELLQQPVYIAHRPLKDPTTILMLDPACGSMHFGLYAFDLFETIYAEAWEAGWTPDTDFPYLDQPTIDHATVHLDPQCDPFSNYSSATVPFEDACIVLTDQSDGGDGVVAATPYIVASTSKFRVPFSYRVKLSEFDYQQALRDGILTEATGEQFVRAVDCFTYREIPSRHSPDAYAAFQRLVPRLIIEYNIHGIDIDPRAVQIAGLSLWLRAQKSWQAQRIKPQERPTIRKANIVCAEPMPEDKALLEEFLQGLRNDRLETLIRRVLNVPENQRVRATPTMADALCNLVRTVWEEMKLAGEAGSLLKIEEALTKAISKGRAEWEKMPLFRVETFRLTQEKPKVSYANRLSSENADFWERAEVLVLAAFEEYAVQTEDGVGYQRCLFADDSVRGFSFINLCRLRFDVILMNPPFGASSKILQNLLADKQYHNRDLAADFITNAIRLTCANGMIGAITTRTIFFLKGFLDWRDILVKDTGGPQCFLDIGYGVLDAAVEASAVTLQKKYSEVSGNYIRALGMHENLENIGPNALFQYPKFIVNAKSFARVPRYPFAYWISKRILFAFSTLPSIGEQFRVLSGGNPRDDFRFVRLWLETPICPASEFVPYSKGGEFSLYYFDVHLMLKWKNNAEELKVQAAEYRRELGWSPDWRALMMNYDHYFLPGITWPRRTSRLSFRFLPRGCVFGDKSPVILPGEENDLNALIPLIAYLNSSSFNAIISLMVGSSELAQSFEVGIVKSCPVLQDNLIDPVSKVREIYQLLQLMDSFNEDSHAFINFCSPTSIEKNLATTYVKLSEWRQQAVERVLENHLVLEKVFSSFFGTEDKESQITSLDFSEIQISHFVSNCISYFVGCTFGRWDVQFSIGKKSVPDLPGPFDSLPIYAPGMLQKVGNIGSNNTDVAGYPLRISWLGILVDDPGHIEDIEGRVREVLRVIWPDRADSIEQEACETLGVASLRAYFAIPSGFFDDHLKRYTKSRRAAPIYWPLATPSGSYTLWLYYHRLTDQTLYSCVNDFVEPKLKGVNDDLNKLRQRANRSRQDEKELDQLTDLALELAAFRDELLHIARFWQPNLNDGVQITAAPLWRLFQHRGWQKRLKETWEALEAGDYDWAHLAHSIWPERVREKCKTDKSLAIAHDLEHLYVEPVKPVKAKKGGRKLPADEDEQGELL